MVPSINESRPSAMSEFATRPQPGRATQPGLTAPTPFPAVAPDVDGPAAEWTLTSWPTEEW